MSLWVHEALAPLELLQEFVLDLVQLSVKDLLLLLAIQELKGIIIAADSLGFFAFFLALFDGCLGLDHGTAFQYRFLSFLLEDLSPSNGSLLRVVLVHYAKQSRLVLVAGIRGRHRLAPSIR